MIYSYISLSVSDDRGFETETVVDYELQHRSNQL